MSDKYWWVPPWWVLGAFVVLGIAARMIFADPVVPPYEPPPTVETSCVNGQVWTMRRHGKFGMKPDEVVIVNSAPVKCEQGEQHG